MTAIAFPLPQKPGMERALLGALILDGRAITRLPDLLDAGDLYDDRHKRILEVLQAMSDENAAIDMVALIDRLGGDVGRCGGVAYVAALSDATPTTDALPYYAREIRQAAIRRRLILRAQAAAAAAANGEDLDEVRATLTDGLDEVARRGWIGARPLMEQMVADMLERMERAHAGESIGLPHGIIPIEQAAPIEPGWLWVLAGRPAMGKTSLALNIAAGAASQGVGVGVFELEMVGVDLGYRIACSKAGVRSTIVREGKASRSAAHKVREAAEEVATWPLWVDDSPGLKVEQIMARARSLKSRHPELALLVVDHIGLCGTSKGVEGRSRQIGHVSGKLKELAKELEIGVIALSQLNRAVEQRPNKRPTMSDLRDSGEIEQDADVIVLLYRDEYYNPDTTTDPGVAEAIVAKARHGKPGTVRLAWHGDTTTFSALHDERRGVGMDPERWLGR